MWPQICESLSGTVGKKITYLSHQSVSGGCINSSYKLQTDCGPFFVKTNSIDSLSMFRTEAKSLQAITESQSIRAPKCLHVSAIRDRAVLILEYIPMQESSETGMQLLGEQLAKMHQATHPQFGWFCDNYIGKTEQSNATEDSWITFFKTHRIEHQIALCQSKGLTLNGGQILLENLAGFFEHYTPKPSLLHGDLWGGNIGVDLDGAPVIFDPACYYGDREADIAFTEMFGGFSKMFYDSYNRVLPLDRGYEARKRLYNLYHELNHYYLFGGGYGRQAQQTVKQLLKQL